MSLQSLARDLAAPPTFVDLKWTRTYMLSEYFVKYCLFPVVYLEPSTTMQQARYSLGAWSLHLYRISGLFMG